MSGQLDGGRCDDMRSALTPHVAPKALRSMCFSRSADLTASSAADRRCDAAAEKRTRSGRNVL